MSNINLHTPQEHNVEHNISLIRQRVHGVVALFALVTGFAVAVATSVVLDFDLNSNTGNFFHLATLIFVIALFYNVVQPLAEWTVLRYLGFHPKPFSEQELKQIIIKRANTSRWVISSLIWALGMLIILWLWDIRKFIPGSIGDIFEAILYVMSFYYIFVLGLIREWISWFLGNRQ
jgi:hypothetical protein